MAAPALLTIDYEDYRRQELRDHLGGHPAPNPAEVMRQTELLLDVLGGLSVRATFFCVGRLVGELPSSVWKQITQSHRVGCHSFEHHRVNVLGAARFREDTRRAKDALEQATSTEVLSYRAPYFSVDGCEGWYGEVLGELGFRFDSSQRLNHAPPGFSGTLPLAGSSGRTRLVPLPSVGLGSKRLTVLGGTYFRLLPTSVCLALLQRASRQGFTPMIYLHPYDLDPDAAPLSYPAGHHQAKAGDRLRRVGRVSARTKLEVLARHFEFGPLETQLA